MGTYITIALQTDPGEILAGMIADYQARMPGWVPYDGAPEVALMGVFALRHAVRLDVDSQVIDSIYRYSGTTIDGVPYNAATYAVADSTWTLSPAAPPGGYVIPAGLRVAIPINGSDFAEFLTSAVTTAEGDTTASVPLTAAVAGAASSGLSGAPVLQDARTWVASVSLDEPTQGGQDAELDPDYLDRLTRKRRRATDTIVTAIDAAQALLDDVPGVGRVLILDNSDDTTVGGVPGAFRAIICAVDGSDCSSDVKTAALALLGSPRLLDLAPYVADPIRTDVAVTFMFTTLPGWDPTATAAAGEAAVTAYADPAGWGAKSTAGGVVDWEDDLAFRYAKVYLAVGGVPGVDAVTEVKIDTVADTDATLTGPGALPNLTSVAGTPV